MKKLLIGLFFLGLLSFNVIVRNDGSTISHLNLSNVCLLQANAGEMTCNQANENECTITSAGGVVGKSTGQLVYNN